jgi:hypothetical protein
MVLPTIPISFLRTVRIKEGRRSTDLADTLDPNPITSNSHITDLHRLLTNLFHFSKYQYSPTTIPSFQSQPTLPIPSAPTNLADYYPIIPKSTDITDSTSPHQSRRLLSHHSKVNRQIPIHITKNSETIYYLYFKLFFF